MGSGLSRRSRQLATLDSGASHWLFDQDMFTRFERSESELKMSFSRSRDVDDLNQRISEEFVDSAISANLGHI